MVVLKNDYSHCPLKKRPLSICYDGSGGEQTEPQDLSLKCAKEAPSIDTKVSFAHDVYPQEAQMASMTTEASCTKNIDHELQEKMPGLYVEEIQSKNIPVHKSYLQNMHILDACTKNIHAEEPSPQDVRVEASCIQRRYTQVICTRDSSIQAFKKFIPNTSSISTSEPTSSKSSSLTNEMYTAPKHFCKRKTLPSHSVNTATGNREDCEVVKLKDEGSPPLSVPALGTLGLPTCSQSHSSKANATTGRETFHRRVSPPVEHVNPHSMPVSGVQLSGSDSKFHGTATSPVKVEISSNLKCTSPNLSAPHRPWLAEGPPRPLSNSYPNAGRVPVAPTSHPRSLLVGPHGLWTGMVPFSWPMPPILGNPQPPSPRRPHQRECHSPGSESASSDGSGGSVRNDTRYSCADCSKSYSTYSGLSKHKQFHCAALGAKSFACKHCDKVYTSLGALKMHIRTHTLPCKCPLCGKAFSRPWLLQGHIRTHTGEKPFQCPQCDRCFADRSNLRAHLQTHADIKKYACNTCHKTFSRMSLLNKHTEAACPATHRRPLQ